MNEMQSSIWFVCAIDDLRAAKTLHEAKMFPAACFHAQQAAEKSFKGILSLTNEEFGKIHSIGALMKKVKACGYSGIDPMPAAAKLDQFYIPTRYPDSLPVGTAPSDVFDEETSVYAIGLAEATLSLLLTWSKDAGVDIDGCALEFIKCSSCHAAPCVCPKGFGL